MRERVEARIARRVTIIGRTTEEARRILIEGPSGLLRVSPPWSRPAWEPGKKELTWPNGAKGFVYSADRPDALRGSESDTLLADEAAAWRYPDAWDQAVFGLRGGNDPRAAVMTTPRPIPLVRTLLADPTTVATRGSTYANRANLPPSFLAQLLRRYEGTRIGRQELLAELLDDVPGALWRRDAIERARLRHAPPLTRVVVAIDPAVSSDEGADETGIVVAGRDAAGHGYVLGDRSGRYAPIEWARKAIEAYRLHDADRIVAEVNNGGEMVETTLRIVDGNVAYRAVRASRGKVVRAEPVAALYEQGRVHHLGMMPELEDQLCQFTSDYDRARQGSPDRVDALVWALTDLLVEQAAGMNIFEFYRQEAARVAAERAKTVANA